MIRLELNIDCRPQGRPRFVNGHAIDPTNSRNFKRELILLLRSKRRAAKPVSGALRVNLKIFRSLKKIVSRRYGDIDNLVKGILDAVTQSAVVWKDDAQIVELTAAKFADRVPRLVIEVEEIKQ